MGGHQNSEYRGDRETSASHRESGVLVCTCTELLLRNLMKLTFEYFISYL